MISESERSMKRGFLLFLVAGIFLLAGCDRDQTPNGDGMARSYTQISQDEAKEMMALDDGHIVVDARRQDEFADGHIPGAICIPNESIGTEQPQELPDLEQIILLYCRSGIRSKQAAQKLFDMGYANVYEFGGIDTWTGEMLKEEESGESLPSGAAAGEQPMQIRVSDGINTIIYALNYSPSAKSLYGMLPLDAEVENYGSNEKIFYPEQKIDTTGGIEDGGAAGGLALFSPWGNVVMYYGSFEAYPGLYILGEAVEGTDQVPHLSGIIHIEAR